MHKLSLKTLNSCIELLYVNIVFYFLIDLHPCSVRLRLTTNNTNKDKTLQSIKMLAENITCLHLSLFYLMVRFQDLQNDSMSIFPKQLS